jgi:hypothetical protein
MSKAVLDNALASHTSDDGFVDRGAVFGQPGADSSVTLVGNGTGGVIVTFQPVILIEGDAFLVDG